MQAFNINKVIENILHITELANAYIDVEAPWALRKTDPDKMQQVLYLLMETLRYIAIMLQHFIILVYNYTSSLICAFLIRRNFCI